MARREEVAEVAEVRLDQVYSAEPQEVYDAYQDRQSDLILQVTELDDALFWRVGTRYYLDCDLFRDVVAIDDLRYSKDNGLFDGSNSLR